MEYSAWCSLCARVTTHQTGTCQVCAGGGGRPGCGGRCGQRTVTVKTLGLVAEALRRRLPVPPEVVDDVIDYVLENDPRMGWRTR